jgi:hypothetical protein
MSWHFTGRMLALHRWRQTREELGKLLGEPLGVVDGTTGQTARCRARLTGQWLGAAWEKRRSSTGRSARTDTGGAALGMELGPGTGRGTGISAGRRARALAGRKLLGASAGTSTRASTLGLELGAALGMALGPVLGEPLGTGVNWDSAQASTGRSWPPLGDAHYEQDWEIH